MAKFGFCRSCAGRVASLREGRRGLLARLWPASLDAVLLLVLASLAMPLSANDHDAPQQGPLIVVEALFSGQAMLRIDGKRRRLAVGQTSPEGVHLVSADARAAEVEFQGQRQRLGLGDQIAARYRSPPEGISVRLLPGGDGIYRSNGSVNGLPTTMTIDTGATSIAINRQLAAQLGLDYRRDGNRIRVGTASGDVDAYRVRLDRVRVGPIERRNLAAVVIDADSPETVLVGGTFLNTLELHREGATLMLISPAP